MLLVGRGGCALDFLHSGRFIRGTFIHNLLCLLIQMVSPSAVVAAQRLAQVDPLPRIVMLSAGLYHSLGVAENGSLFSWGSGTNGRLGHVRAAWSLCDVECDHGVGRACCPSGGSALINPSSPALVMRAYID